MSPIDPDNQNATPPRQGLNFGASGPRARSAGKGAIRIRLAMLMVLLIMVVVAMKEAGKPERWAWMGFGKPTIDTDQVIRLKEFAPTTGNAEIDQAAALRLKRAKEDHFTNSGGSDREAVGGEAKLVLDASPLSLSGQPLPTLDRKFWSFVTGDFSDEKLQVLFQIVRAVCRSQGVSESQARDNDADQPASVIKELDSRHDAWHQQMLAEASTQRDGDRKTKSIRELFEFDHRWQEMIEPTLRQAIAGEDVLFAGQLYNRSLFEALQPTWMRDVQDRTAMGDPADRMAWLWLWDHSVLDSTNASAAAAEPVSLLQLSGQPAVWRAKPVRLEGIAKTVRRIEQQPTDLPVNAYFEVWVEPANSVDRNLCCVYTASVPPSMKSDAWQNSPPDFPAESPPDKAKRIHRSTFHSVNQDVTLTGRFFKLRSYRDAGGGVSHAPVVIAKTIAARGASASASTTTGHNGKNEIAKPAWLFGVVAIASTFAAVLLFRIARTRQRPVGHRALQHVRSTLQHLQDDESLQSDALPWSSLEQVEQSDPENFEERSS